MAIEILKLVILMIGLMIILRFAFAEIDGRTALKRSNLSYFLNFEEKFKYRRMYSTMMIMGFSLIVFSDVNIFTKEGIIYFLFFFVIAMISDYISSYAYHVYGRYRYKKQIDEAKEFLIKLNEQINQDVSEEDAYVYGQDYQFVDIVNEYVYPNDHFVCLSTDGGEMIEEMTQFPQVAFLIDRKNDEAKERLEDKPIRFTTLTKDNRYPFKDQKMDVVVCYNENFNPDEGKRIMKEGGTLLINQLGSENLFELYAFLGPKLFTAKWDLATLKRGLANHGFSILGGHEERAEIRFRTLASFHHYIKDMAFVKIDDIKNYVNQYFIISQAIEKHGFFAMHTHRFYVAARKDNVV